MELKEILQKLTELEKVIDPGECNLLSAYLSGFIIDAEEEMHELNLIYSNEWLKTRELVQSDKKTDMAMENGETGRKRQAVKMKIAQLKRLRGDLKDRFQVLIMTKRY
jgi:hypothetical protein